MSKKFLEFNKKLYPEIKSMYGPYIRKDGRTMLSGKTIDNKSFSISYPKFLIENKLNKRLGYNDTIDHIDGNPLNNDLNNLRVIDRKSHAFNDVKRLYKPLLKVICEYCGKEFEIKNKLSHSNRRHSGYFCSKSCSGKYGSEIQKGLRTKRFVDKIKPVFYKLHSESEMYDWENMTDEISFIDIIENSIFSKYK